MNKRKEEQITIIEADPETPDRFIFGAVIFIFILFILFLIIGAVYAKEPYNFEDVQLERVYDGDTIFVNIKGVHPLIGNNMGIRINKIDAPELRTRNSCEKDKAEVAKIVLALFLDKANRIDLLNVKKGKYFRFVADVVADGVNISEYLIDKKLAVGYDGSKKLVVDWCK